MADETRRYDLMELLEKYKTAPNEDWRNYYGKVITKISRETIEIRSLREKLVEAIRKGDRRRVRYYQEELRVIDRNRTGGRETNKDYE